MGKPNDSIKERVAGQRPLTKPQREVVRLKLEGRTQVEIAREMGIHRRNVAQICASESVKQAIVRHQERVFEEAAAHMKAKVPEIVQRLVKIALESPDEQLAVKTSFGILDRVGMGPMSKTEVTGANGAALGVVLKAEEFNAERARLMAELEEARSE